jgi:hypothetical protein
MDSIEKILYIGAWSDINPIIDLKNVKEFIYIDTQPLRQNGPDEYNEKLYSRRDFIKEITKKFGILNYTLKNKRVIDNEYYKKRMTL